jgi:hypothetical protein
MNNKAKITITFLFAALLIGIIYSYQRFNRNEKTISRLASEAEELEAELKQTKAKLNETEAKIGQLELLNEIPLVDRNGAVRSNVPNRTVNFTGQVLETQIDGDFEGWDGETIFRMMDGTIWQQASYDYSYHYSYMPDVIIYEKAGSYYMKVEDVDDEIEVRRIK